MNGLNQGHRNLYDTVLLLTPNDRVSAYVNFDYGHSSVLRPARTR